MNLDLTGLAEITQSAAGEPLMVPLGAISCDPDQPRKQFDEASLLELADSIRAVGVVQPISVRPDLVNAGRYVINYGERRYRAALIAGLLAIPAFVHRTPNDYTQITENLHRADLSPMEMALFIKKRMDAGEKRAEIAARLGYKKSYVTEHLALLESPACVEKAYANGVTSTRTLYDLRRLHDEYPQLVDTWCRNGAEVTRDSIGALAEKVRHDEQFDDGQSPHRGDEDTQAEQNPPFAAASHLRAPEVRTIGSAVHEGTANTPLIGSVKTKLDGLDSSRHDKHVDNTRSVDSLRRPLRIKVRHNGRIATVQSDSIVRIQYEDGGMAEVPLLDTVVLGAIRT